MRRNWFIYYGVHQQGDAAVAQMQRGSKGLWARMKSWFNGNF